MLPSGFRIPKTFRMVDYKNFEVFNYNWIMNMKYTIYLNELLQNIKRICFVKSLRPHDLCNKLIDCKMIIV